MNSYEKFLENKRNIELNNGFDPIFIPDFLFDFQKSLLVWAIRKGRGAIFADCGLGKTPIQLSWAENIVKKTNKKVLILSPLAVTSQTKKEGEKFGIECFVNKTGNAKNSEKIVITNYEQLFKFNPSDFIGVVCDESGILKNYSGEMRRQITEFCNKKEYTLLCSATPAPNDYMELGNSCEALQIMRRVEMLATFFTHDGGETNKWVLKGHSEDNFWKFLASWSRALRFPSDIGFSDDKFILPELITKQITLPSKPQDGMLLVTQAMGLKEQREERRSTIEERCDSVAKVANSNNDPFIAWCSLNIESSILSKRINGAVELSGSDSSYEKERKMDDFSNGKIRCLVTKPTIAGFGLNWQHCGQISFFPSHSHEQYYQSVRRCWRFGRKDPVTVYIVTTEAESNVLKNMKRKEANSNLMFKHVVKNMNKHYDCNDNYEPNIKMERPSWM